MGMGYVFKYLLQTTQGKSKRECSARRWYVMLRNETGAFCAFVIGRWRLRCLSVGGIGVWRWRRGEEFAVFGRGFVEGCYGGRGCIRYGFGFTSWGWI